MSPLHVSVQATLLLELLTEPKVPSVARHGSGQVSIRLLDDDPGAPLEAALAGVPLPAVALVDLLGEGPDVVRLHLGAHAPAQARVVFATRVLPHGVVLLATRCT